MSEAAAQRMTRPAVFSIPAHRSFADALAAGVIARFGPDPLSLAQGRILLPNNRAGRAITEAFVRASGSGLLLPRMVTIGDAEIEERIGGVLDPLDAADPIPPAIDPLQRLTAIASLVRGEGEPAAEAVRLSADVARTLDALTIEEVDQRRLAEAALDAPELAIHWQRSLNRFEAVLERWPAMLAAMGKIDLAERRNRVLRALERRWAGKPPPGFTIAAGITTAAPAVAALLARVARMDGGMVVLPALALPADMPDEEWEALGPDEEGRGNEAHPQYHLKLLLDRMGVARSEVERWRWSGRASAPAVRSRAIAHAMTAAQFSDKWKDLPPPERRLTGVRMVELADPASEAQAIALALREALETPGRTAALVTPDRPLARRVAALLKRWSIEADDSAGTPLAQLAPGTLLLDIASAAAEDLAPVPLLALLKHPLVGGEGEHRRRWLDDVRLLDLALRGPRPAEGLDGLGAHFAEREKERKCRGCLAAWTRIRPKLDPLAAMFETPLSLSQFGASLTAAAQRLAGHSGWQGADGRAAAELVSSISALSGAADLTIGAEDAVPILRHLLEEGSIRPAFGGHPRIFIWGLLEARLQQADLVVLGGLNEGVWPALPVPDPWLAPRIRANLGIPGLDFRVGLSAHDFASALGAPRVLITRSRRDSRSPTVASRLLLRLDALTGGLARDVRLERIAAALDKPAEVCPRDQPAPCPSSDQRPRRISVTAVDRLKADPFAFYAQSILALRPEEPVDADHTAAWKGSAVHEVLESWLKQDDCDPEKLTARAAALLQNETIHPMLRALWQPRLMEAIEWIANLERENQAEGRQPLAAEATGEAEMGGVTVYGKADRIDRFGDGALAIVDYKTGKAPPQKQVDAGFALQLGLLGLIAESGGFEGIEGKSRAHEYWSLAKNGDSFGKMSCPDAKLGGAEAFLEHARAHFLDAARRWLTGNEPFAAKLHPAYARDDYDHLMRLEEWYGRE